ncbi:flagellar type III secretion system pore protein FliP [Methylohalobius crimeensis]|uniref:flagellar type III secretion system pore protein FliP n=1 Tax=Methylohalobius crimeensis TaxID=244365 RepID=UPI0003B517D1|nr:flagellar type III secretion system pore protein FliP [Methylohalobius crimeensis]
MRIWWGIGLALAPLAVVAAPGMDAVQVISSGDGGKTYSISIQVLALMTALTVLPALLLSMTAFTRIMIVLAILRQALGTGQTPNNQILLGISLLLTGFIMMPVFDKAYQTGVAPYLEEKIEAGEALRRSLVPVRQFMLRQTRETDLALFVRLSGREDLTSIEEAPMTLVVPAFMTSELKTAFQIGFLLFLPFLVIDLVVASVLMSMGMMMLSPVIISLPFKLMLFVLVDGWALVMETLAASFYTG